MMDSTVEHILRSRDQRVPRKLGIAVNNLGGSQLNYFLIKNANSLLLNDPLLDITVFFENQGPTCLAVNFPIMPIYEAWSFAGPVVATTFTTAEKLLSFPSPTTKLFYVWDLEWTRHTQRRSYREWASVYGNTLLTLISRGADHMQVIEKAWNRDVMATNENCDLSAILEMSP